MIVLYGNIFSKPTFNNFDSIVNCKITGVIIAIDAVIIPPKSLYLGIIINPTITAIRLAAKFE